MRSILSDDIKRGGSRRQMRGRGDRLREENQALLREPGKRQNSERNNGDQNEPFHDATPPPRRSGRHRAIIGLEASGLSRRIGAPVAGMAPGSCSTVRSYVKEIGRASCRERV